MVVCHDVKNNNISSHRTIVYRPACQFIACLFIAQYTNYLSRRGSRYWRSCFAEGKDRPTCLVSYSAQECSLFPQQNFYSPRANKTTQEYLKLHQSAKLELKPLRLVVAHNDRLSELIGNMGANSRDRRRQGGRRKQDLNRS